MDNKPPMGQTPNPMMNQIPDPQTPTSAMPPMAPAGHTNSTLISGGVIAVIVIVLLGLWYFYSMNGVVSETTDTPSALEQTTLPALSSGDTTADISADLNQIPDTAATLGADAAASAQAVSDF